jgi:hypothetical protein
MRPLILLAGATHRRLLQRPVHGEDRPAAAIHPRRMHHHLPLCKRTYIAPGFPWPFLSWLSTGSR